VKPQLHNSHLVALSLCGERFRLSYLEGLRVRPGIAAAVGSGVHAVAALNLTRKMQGGALMPLEEVRDAARDAFARQWDEGVALLPSEIEHGAVQVQGEAIDRTVRLSEAHATKLAPAIRPSHVERAWVVEVEGFPFDLAGEIDVQEDRILADDCTVVAPSSIRDLKTSGKMPTEKLVATSSQLSMYAVAKQALEGELPDRVALDYAVTGKSGAVTVGSFVSSRRPVDIAAFFERLERAAAVIEAQAFTPARPYEDWVCSPTWCGYARTNPDTGRPYCKFFSEAPAFRVGADLSPTSDNGGFTSGNSKRARKIISGTDRDALLASL
jgi:hypothetical protein